MSELPSAVEAQLLAPPPMIEHRQGRGRLTDLVALAVTVLILVVAIVGPWITPASAQHSSILDAFQAPSAQHWFGTDDQGRDVFWRVVEGTRLTLLSSIVVVVFYSLIGVVVACLAIIGGRWADEVLMRCTDITIALPGMVVALGFAAALGPSLKSAIIAMILAGWPTTARLLRGIMQEKAASPFVEGARVLGASRSRLIVRHILPNSLDVLVVKWAGDIGSTVLVLSGLSFIGVGAQPPSPEWGAMVAAAQSSVTTSWWVALFPGAAIALTATAFGILGDVFQTRMNPTLRGRGRR
jgi:peptide/nickel transport system permease protein